MPVPRAKPTPVAAHGVAGTAPIERFEYRADEIDPSWLGVTDKHQREPAGLERTTRIEHRSRRHGRTGARRTHPRAPPTDTRTRHGYERWHRLRRSGHEQRSRACD